MSSHEQFEQVVTASLLGDADADEQRMASTHTEACASCRELGRRLGRVVGDLPMAVDQVPPPARLRNRILAAAAATPQVRSPVRSGFAAAIPLPSARTWRRLQRPSARVAAAAAAVVLTIAGTYAVASQWPAQPPQVARFSLTGTGPLHGAQATVVDLKQDGVVIVDFKSMPAIAPDRVYEFWLITPAGRADPAGVFQPQPDGSYVLVLTKPLSGYREAGVTIEQGPNGSNLPSQSPELLGTIG